MSDIQKQAFDLVVEKVFHGDIDAFLAASEHYSQQTRRNITPGHANVDFSDKPIIIDLQNVSREYKLNRKHKVTAIKDVSFQIHQGEIVAIVGTSGSGKSTLMSLIGGLDKPSSGTITVDGTDLHTLSDSKLARYRGRTIGFVFQSFFLQPFLKVNKNIEVALMFAKVKRKLRKDLIGGVINAVQLNDRAEHLPKELSGGQIQRVAIARALVNRPKILLADEPTGNLDSKNSRHVMELLQQIRYWYNMTIVIVTHDEAIAAAADRIITVSDGEVSS